MSTIFMLILRIRKSCRTMRVDGRALCTGFQDEQDFHVNPGTHVNPVLSSAGKAHQ